MVDKLTPSRVNGRHTTLGESVWELGEGPDGKNPQLLFTENESNSVQLWNKENYTPFVKDAFHRYIVDGELTAVNPKMRGSK
ncbi:PREDICTED: uncharacterized protein YMR196W-like, partial [Priapulus caudatus]|uniref:Uncharacterized protein YMR196W-like n=1 Tax=Priapulus caudatus TaxID=37621 RepID=A0ABM1F227_PRICU